MTKFLDSLLAVFKTTSIDMTGQWEGFYGYGKSYPASVQKKTVRFIAELRGTNKIQGTIKEDETGIPEVAVVEGKVDGTKIRFVKTYKKRYTIDEKENLYTFDEPQEIIYTGLYDKSEHKFIGHWKIMALYKSEDGKERMIVSVGNWEMRRQ